MTISLAGWKLARISSKNVCYLQELEKKAAADKLKAAAAGEKYEAPMDEAEAEPDWSRMLAAGAGSGRPELRALKKAA